LPYANVLPVYAAGRAILKIKKKIGLVGLSRNGKQDGGRAHVNGE
jgi:hypothetical protein